MFKKILAVWFVLTLIYVGVYGKPETHSVRAMEICIAYLDRRQDFMNRLPGMYSRIENKNYVATGLRADFYMGHKDNVRCSIRDNGAIWYLAINGRQLIK